jgi:serine/threonine-protein kinase
VLGTPDYMAPEQARGEEVDERADVFALGAVLCTILTGQPPYPAGDRADVLRHAREANLAVARARVEACGVDAELVELCLDCLEPEPARRPGNAGVLAHRLAARQAAQEQRPWAEAQQARQQARHQAARAAVLEQRLRRTMAALALVAALALIALLPGAAALALERPGASGACSWAPTGRIAAERLREARDAVGGADGVTVPVPLALALGATVLATLAALVLAVVLLARRPAGRGG